MPSGIVKWFNSAKGYGFICADGGGQDVFAHFSAIVMDGYKCLKAGQVVNFEIHQGSKGLHASNIRPESLYGASEAPQPVNATETAPQTEMA